MPCFRAYSWLSSIFLFYVYYGRRRHRRFRSPFHVPCINILLFIRHTPHQASIRTHTPAIHTYLSSLLSRTYFLPVLLQSPRFFCAGNDGVLHRLTHISLLLWVTQFGHSTNASKCCVPVHFPFCPSFWFLRFYPRRFVLQLLYILYNVYLLWTYDTPHILLPFPLSVRFLDKAFVVPFSGGIRSTFLREHSFWGCFAPLGSGA